MTGDAGVEGVLFVVKADGGFEVASENLWNLVRSTALPTFIVVNRMNKEHSAWDETLAGIRERVGVNAVPIQLPAGDGELPLVAVGVLGDLDRLAELRRRMGRDGAQRRDGETAAAHDSSASSPSLQFPFPATTLE